MSYGPYKKLAYSQFNFDYYSTKETHNDISTPATKKWKEKERRKEFEVKNPLVLCACCVYKNKP